MRGDEGKKNTSEASRAVKKSATQKGGMSAQRVYSVCVCVCADCVRMRVRGRAKQGRQWFEREI